MLPPQNNINMHTSEVRPSNRKPSWQNSSNNNKRPSHFAPRDHFRRTEQNFGRKNFEKLNESNGEFWCETCDRGFYNSDMLESHKKQHQKCNIDGCQFIAHPKVITKHIQMQHSTGLYKKIANLSKPEDIQKWIDERKRKYPTKENIERKTAEIKEKIERGEKMGLPKHEKNKRSKFYSEVGKKRPHNSNKPSNFRNRSTGKSNKLPKIVPVVENSRKLKPFIGIQSLLTSEEDIHEDDTICDLEIDDSAIQEQLEVVEKLPKPSEPVVCGALSALMCDYGSSDDEIQTDDQRDINVKGPVPIVQNDTQVKPSVSAPQGEVNSDNDSGPEETKVTKDVLIENIDSNNDCALKKSGKKNKVSWNQQRRPIKHFKAKLPSTLLHKLLKNEIQQERNIVLQCIRYIIKNDYFNENK